MKRRKALQSNRMGDFPESIAEMRCCHPVNGGRMASCEARKAKAEKERRQSIKSSFALASFRCFLIALILTTHVVKGFATTQHQPLALMKGFPSRSLQQHKVKPYHQRTKPFSPKIIQTRQFADAADSDLALSNDDKLTPKRFFQEFCFGANLVHSEYLSFLWKYSIVQSLYVTIPIAILLWASRFWNHTLGTSVYNLIYYPLYFVWNMSSGVASVLQLPLEAMRWTIAAFPTIMIGILEYLPNILAVPLVQAVLSIRDTIAWISMLASNSQIASFLASVTAVLIWRPAVEELEYRSILNKFFFAPRVIQSKLQQRRSDSSTPTVEYIPLDSDAYMATSFTKKEDERNDEPSTSTSTLRRRKILLPLADESNRILMGSILFAATRLGWLSWDPVSGDHSSPYSWTIGFVQSIMAHFSGQMLPQVRPGLQIWILLLAIYQTVGTYLIAQNVFANLYRERGLAASVGAHVTWTISKGTIPFRLLWRFWGWCVSIVGTPLMTGDGSKNVNRQAASKI